MTSEDESLVGILKSVMKEVPEGCKEASKILIECAESGFLEEHQTKSSMDSLTNKLISSVGIRGVEDED